MSELKPLVPPTRIKTGTYTGDDAATQAIIGTGQPKAIIIYPQLDAHFYGEVFKTDQDGANAWFYETFQKFRYIADMIISLDADGFTVGDGTGFANVLNVYGVSYSYVVWS